MKYFVDTEFIERFNTSLLLKRKHVIDLISIGIVGEDGREYSAICRDYNYNDADAWVKKNVILPLYLKTVHGDQRNRISVETFHKFYGKSSATIADEIYAFINPHMNMERGDYNVDMMNESFWAAHNIIELKPDDKSPMFRFRARPTFYGYFADYDWVVFCSLYGRMIDLPEGYPMYCRDLKQMLDEKVESLDWYYGRDCWSNTGILGQGPVQEKDRPASFDEKLKKVKELECYPKNTNAHDAVADAKWNKALYHFIAHLK